MGSGGRAERLGRSRRPRVGPVVLLFPPWGLSSSPRLVPCPNASFRGSMPAVDTPFTLAPCYRSASTSCPPQRPTVFITGGVDLHTRLTSFAHQGRTTEPLTLRHHIPRTVLFLASDRWVYYSYAPSWCANKVERASLFPSDQNGSTEDISEAVCPFRPIANPQNKRKTRPAVFNLASAD